MWNVSLSWLSFMNNKLKSTNYRYSVVLLKPSPFEYSWNIFRLFESFYAKLFFFSLKFEFKYLDVYVFFIKVAIKKLTDQAVMFMFRLF